MAGDNDATIQTETVDLWSFVEGGTRLILTIDGRALGAVVPMEDLSRLNNNPKRGGSD
jgi:hypothetical protein